MNIEENRNFSKYRKQFFDILANYWESYGFPGLSGYIDALMWLEPNQNGWTQVTISKRLKELFTNESKYPTSIASVNRAIKTNVQYGTLKRKGSHKLGYTYHVADDSTLLELMFQQFIDKNRDVMDVLEELRSSDIKKLDPELYNAVQVQYLGIQLYNRAMEEGLQYLIKCLRNDNNEEDN